MSFHNLWLKLQFIYPIYVFIHLSILGTVDKTYIFYNFTLHGVYPFARPRWWRILEDCIWNYYFFTHN